MRSNPENYMDRFETPEQFIRAEILSNRGSNNIVDKADLLEVAEWKAEEGEDLSKLSKAQLFDRIVEQYGNAAYAMFPVGVSSYCFQLKFGITHKEVLKLAKAGVLAVTGERKFRKYGKYLYAKTYSAFDYFRLTLEEVHKVLDGSK